MKERNSGILMHISSLPGDFGCGTLGYEARLFIDKLCEAGFEIWQLLPICATDEVGSPYKSPAIFSGNPMLIDLVALYEEGLITDKELDLEREIALSATRDELFTSRIRLLRTASTRVIDRTPIIDYIDAHPELSRTAYYLALSTANGGTHWQSWTEYRCDIDELFFRQFVEFKFYEQWAALKSYANARGISIIGDMPIYVALESADVWAEPNQFLLNEKGYPTVVAGVPPDYFAKDGQLWGNPLYDWKKMKADGFAWWRRRICHALSLFDGIRIDHIRAIEAYWEIPSTAPTAKEGRWRRGPGRRFIDMIRELAKDKLIIAEDLGDITDKVRSLVNYSGFPGMRVLQFAFLGDERSLHLPHNCPENVIAYTGTHDNNTLVGYLGSLDEWAYTRLVDYVGGEGESAAKVAERAISTLMATRARTVILPVQDVFSLGEEHRMNTPGTADRNWSFRLSMSELLSFPTEKYKYLNNLFGR